MNAPPPSAPTPSDDLRQRLRSLGYLNAPVDRFVLGAADQRRSRLTVAASASVRIGILASLLLGPAGAIGLATKLPQLITSLTDAVVVAAYLAVVFGVVAAVGAFAVVLAAGSIAQSFSTSPAFARRARRVAGAAGVVIFLACLAYLTLWWQTAAGSSSTSSGVFSAAVLGVAVAISLVLAHAVTVTALALVARFHASEDRGAGFFRSASLSWRATAVLGLLAFAGAATLLLATAPGNSIATSPTLTVVPTGERVLVIAIDGVDLALLDRLRSATPGALPALSKILSGATARMSSDRDRDPARVWTTIATGQPPEKHGISALEGRQLAGVGGRLQTSSRFGDVVAGATDLVRLTRPALASGNERRTPAFWEIAARTGLRTSVVHWWATWPAVEKSEDAATVLSDRALLRLEQGGALDSEIAPASLYDMLEKTWGPRRARATMRATTALDPAMPKDVAAIVERSAQLDAEIADLAADPALANVDLEVIYLPGLDIAQFGLLTQDAGIAATPSALAARVNAVERYYTFLDGVIATLAGENDRTVMLVTQPGRVSAPGDGLIALAGAPASTAGTRASSSPLAIAASVLYLLGVPVAEDLAAPVSTDLLAPTFLAAHHIRTTTTYGLRRMEPRKIKGTPLDQEMIERMRSLGYVR